MFRKQVTGAKTDFCDAKFKNLLVGHSIDRSHKNGCSNDWCFTYKFAYLVQIF